MNSSNPFKNLKKDIPASIVVFFVALPLCLGIALASGAPPFSGLIAGIIGGIVVGSLSNSQLGVSGPAAGLAAIVAIAITDLGGFEIFLVSVVIAGVVQIVFGFMKLGIIGYYFPSSVIKGMLTGIGIIIFLKQIPHFFGLDKDPEGDWDFFQVDGETTFSEILNIGEFISPGATLIGCVALAILLIWSNILSGRSKLFEIIQGPLVAVVIGILYYVFTMNSDYWSISGEHLVNVPIPENIDMFIGQFSFPDFSQIGNIDVVITGFTIAIVAALETLLCVEATDKLDPLKRVTPTNRELVAQGVGNVASGMIGGLPITQVIVRSSANIQSGGRTKMSAILHGFLLLASIILIPTLMNKIPLSVLAAILLIVGYKLAKPSLFKEMWQAGWRQFVPFIVTVLLLQINFLLGVGVGLAIGIVITLFQSYQNSHFLHAVESDDSGRHEVKMVLAEEVTFFNKATILKELDNLPRNTYLELDVRKTTYLDHDVIEILDDFREKAINREINIKLISTRGTVENPDSFVDFFKLRPQEDVFKF
ncbi:MFS superfamily sulfate permease-like transporter [Nonlabens dokdonensis]|jgi:MFS superfamily sulfate permease-like transporter|uniref:Sulfate permease n=2 Tax=Nonlabens dokdonensis TaxID=328515 RepID=L7WAW0_NONDD|nr:SulP family inorganic anion transporter [Nonlabens dokdonensis]AGC77254.1 sulfate permease [Nonlabens dokdonensis DSW-6]PZX40789.1 MFS superfamily sulfate permease-like transporter [Nonlabens dokdonensis]